MDFKPIRTKKIYEEIVEQIKALIADGKLKPGDKLMSERELAEKMQVGRSAVREAFRALEAMKIIEIRPGEGTYIREASADFIIDALTLVLNAGKETARELMELRKILEVECAGLAAKRRTEKDLYSMKRALQQMERDIEEGNLGEQADLLFHYLVAKASGNAMVLRLMTTISDAMNHIMRKARSKLYRDPALPSKLLEQHWVIYKAIKEKDFAKAQKAMYEHLDNIEKGAFGPNGEKEPVI
ncbi:GntR family transcriptional repressor for pyruvate dehydrogenase complex [Desulfohalotomaculum tongense]|uniref:FadR/GntR family transcriptional regulator n=1 Tax=Desulforadius tongensis TaxID=1216062 RepID=UPI00195C2385|nr:FadR/GntR family transcriptional regulator [Desulforadius tongensis]MBM7855029.1 GntR family transcriptional repressor for pyruvate dehydrogenase complex [Desulforadius tongensis]